ncbi:hypothetical protein J4209_07045, partial [Candidatus Woesearchaeota archaeon]|nr:hypothetical protein [Candidatus Woesearchaeota archaeon]
MLLLEWMWFLMDVVPYDENPNFPQGWWYPFNGTIDEVAIYNRSLNAAEILSHFQKGLLYHSSGTWNATFDAGVNATWGSISWSEELPYGEELPSNQAVETVSGGANMTGNVLLMHFDNDSSVGENDSLVYDWSGRGNNGTAYVNHSDGSIKGPNSTGKLSRAFEFDGDDYINAGNATIINNQTTIEVWFNVPNTVGIKTIVSQWIGIPTWKANNWAIAVNDDNFYSIIMNGSDEVVNPLKHVVQNVKIKSNRWYHFAFVLNASGFAEYYLDGAEVDTHNYGFTANLSKQSPQQPIVIGGTIDKFNFFNGTIDELAIFNRTLSSAEILEHYQRGALDLLARTRTSGDAVSWGSWSVWNGTNHSLSSITGRYIEVQINMTANDTTYTPILYDLTVNISSRPTNATLVIWDDTDSAAKTVNEQIKFYANYTDTNTREPINGSETYGKTSLIAGNGTAGYLEGTGNNSMFSSDLEAIVVGPDNSFLYVADVANQLIRRINLSTNTTSLVAGNGTAGYLEGTGNNSMFNGPDGLSIDSNGTFLYLSDSSNNRIRRITLSTNVTSLISGNGTEGYAEGNSTNSMFNFPLGTAIDTNGNYLYVSDFNNNRIRRIDLSTNTTSLIAGNASCDYKEGTGNNSMFCSPVGIAIDSSNTYLYISDYGNNRIRRIDLSTNKTSLIAGNGTAGYLEGTGNNSMFSSPQFISIEPSNKYLYVADSSNNRIRKIDLTTNTTSLVAGSGTATYLEDVGSGASFNSPYGVATNKNNLYLYVADTNNYRIRRIAIGPSCELSENSSGSWSSAVKMTFNTASRLYEYNTTFAAGGNFSFNATCDGSIAGYAVVDAVDDFYVKSPMVELAGPADGSTDTDGNITFICNATADRNLANISLYHNASGTFALNDTWHFGEFANDSNTLMLCHFNNNYTCTARGNGTPVTNTGTTNVFGKMNNATFIDADDVLNYNATNNFNASNGSIEMWVKPLWNGSDSTNRGFFQIKNDTNINDFKLAKYNAGGGNSLYLDMWSNGAAQTGIGYSVANWKSNEWHHIAATWETNNVILYIDGVNIGSDTSATMPTAIDIIKVGVYDDIWTANATIDEFRIYNRTLTAAEVWKSYQRRNSTAEADVNFTITSIADNKNITWNCLAYDNSSQSSWGDANWSVNVILSDITPPSINFTSPTPPNNTITANTNVQINISITNASDLAEMKLNWNGTNYTFYNNSLVLMYNFDNMSAIGDTSTVAVDVSKYSNNGTFQGAGEPAWNCTDAKYGCALQFDGSNDKIID